MAMNGARVWVSKVANVAPALCSALQAACRNRDIAGALDLQRELAPEYAAFERERAPAAVKYAVSLLRPRIDPTPRLPIGFVTGTTAAIVQAALAKLQGESRSTPFLIESLA